MMRRPLAVLLLLAALGGCGSGEDAGEAPGADPGNGEGSRPGWSQVALLSGPDVGAEVSVAATPLPDQAAAVAFADRLGDPLSDEVVGAARAAEVPDGQVLYGAVVSVGCEVPAGVVVTRSGTDVELRARTEKSGASPQCRVPVTSVALVLVDE